MAPGDELVYGQAERTKRGRHSLSEDEVSNEPQPDTPTPLERLEQQYKGLVAQVKDIHATLRQVEATLRRMEANLQEDEPMADLPKDDATPLLCPILLSVGMCWMTGCTSLFLGHFPPFLLGILSSHGIRIII